MTNWIFEYIGRKKFNNNYLFGTANQQQLDNLYGEEIGTVIATDRAEAIVILSENGIVWSSLYAVKPAPPTENQ